MSGGECAPLWMGEWEKVRGPGASELGVSQCALLWSCVVVVDRGGIPESWMSGDLFSWDERCQQQKSFTTDMLILKDIIIVFACLLALLCLASRWPLVAGVAVRGSFLERH